MSAGILLLEGGMSENSLSVSKVTPIKNLTLFLSAVREEHELYCTQVSEEIQLIIQGNEAKRNRNHHYEGLPKPADTPESGQYHLVPGHVQSWATLDLGTKKPGCVCVCEIRPCAEPAQGLCTAEALC